MNSDNRIGIAIVGAAGQQGMAGVRAAALIMSKAMPDKWKPADCVSLQLEFCKPNLIGRSVSNIGYIGCYGAEYYGISLYGDKGAALPTDIFLGKDNPDYDQVHDLAGTKMLNYEYLGAEYTF